MQCQNCRTPVRLDRSLQNLNPASFKILADAAPSLEPKSPDAPRSAAAKERRRLYNDVSQQAGPPIHKRSVPTGTRSSGKLQPDMSYIDITESVLAADAPSDVILTPTKKNGSIPVKSEAPKLANGDSALAQKLETTNRLFEILSARSDIDHPICSECTELLLDSLTKRQATVLRERDAYVEFLKQAQRDIPTDEERAKTKRDLEDARKREQVALEELEALEAEKAKMEDEIAALDAEADDLDDEEERFWRERNAFTQELTAFQQERDSLQKRPQHDTKVLESLQRTNVFNDAFCIGHDGLFGTINGFRLGRLADHPVEWPEINAALGQCVLLLVVVSEKVGCKIRGYQLLPIGSTSKIVDQDLEAAQTGSTAKSKGTVYELYSSGNLPFGLGLFHGTFDSALVVFLECLRQLGEHVEATSATRMPYKIDVDFGKTSGVGKSNATIGEASIKLGPLGSEQEWTKACKYTLTCCKTLLAYASHLSHESDGGRDTR